MEELGARSNDPDCYKDGKVQFDRLAKTERFREGVERVLQGMESYRVALLCAEREPLACHRTILVLRHLAERACACAISLSSTETEDHPDTMQRLLRELELDETNLFLDKAALIAEAHRLKASPIAYQREGTVTVPAQP